MNLVGFSTAKPAHSFSRLGPYKWMTPIPILHRTAEEKTDLTSALIFE